MLLEKIEGISIHNIYMRYCVIIRENVLRMSFFYRFYQVRAIDDLNNKINVTKKMFLFLMRLADSGLANNLHGIKYKYFSFEIKIKN